MAIELESVKIMQGYNLTEKPCSNWVERTSGGYLTCWFDFVTKELQVATCSDDSFLWYDYAMQSVTAYPALSVYYASDTYSDGCRIALHRRPDGKILLIYSDYYPSGDKWVGICHCWISTSGDGDDWIYYSSLHTTTEQSNVSIYELNTRVALVTSTGRIIIACTAPYVYYGYVYKHCVIYASDNEGGSWSQVYDLTNAYVGGFSQPCQLADGTLYISILATSGHAYIHKSINNGSTWSPVLDGEGQQLDFAEILGGISLAYDHCFFFDFTSGTVFDFCTGLGEGSWLFELEDATPERFENPNNWVATFYADINSMSNLGGVYYLNGKILFHCRGGTDNTPYSWITIGTLGFLLKRGAPYRVESVVNGVVTSKRIRNLRHINVETVEGSRDFTNLTNVPQGYINTKRYVSNWIQKTDGGYMACWFDQTTKTLMTGFCATKAFLTSAYAIGSIAETTSISVTSIFYSQTSLFKRSDGKILLFVLDNTMYTSTTDCYISASGNGDDWAYLSNIHYIESLVGNEIYDEADGGIGEQALINIPTQTQTGRLTLPFKNGGIVFEGYGLYDILYQAYSDDDGVSWTNTVLYGGMYGANVSPNCQLPNGDMFCCNGRIQGYLYVYKSVDNGASWASTGVDWSEDFSDALFDNVWSLSFYYDPITESAYAFTGLQTKNQIQSGGIYQLTDVTSANFIDKTKWVNIGLTDRGYINDYLSIYPIDKDIVFQMSMSGIIKYTVYSNTTKDRNLKIRNANETWGGVTI